MTRDNKADDKEKITSVEIDENRTLKDDTEPSAEKAKKRNVSIHSGHRERLRNKAEELGFEFLEKHEQLEMILFACQKTGDTNELAHRLFERFKSLDNILHAEKEELTEIKGVGPAMADFIRWLPSYVGLFERAAIEKGGRTHVKTEMDVINYIKTFFYGKKIENIYLFSLNSSSYICGITRISEGIRNSADITMHKIAGAAIRHGASEVVLAHNHPSGNPAPSLEDIKMTKMVRDGLAQLRIKLKMHIIVADGTYEIINDSSMNIPYGKF